MIHAKNRKFKQKIIKKISKKRKTAAKSVNFKKITYKPKLAKIKRMISLFFHVYPEFILISNMGLLERMERQMTRKSKELFRSDGKVALCEKMAIAITKECLAGKEFEKAVMQTIKEFHPYKKETRVLRKAIIITTLNEIYEIEKKIYLLKRETQRGINYSKKVIYDFSPAFMYGICKNPNLGLFLDNREEIQNGIDIMFADLETFKAMLEILINLLIKCV